MSQMGKGAEILENFVVSPAGIEGSRTKQSIRKNASVVSGQAIAER
jgi:hypothetical protein